MLSRNHDILFAVLIATLVLSQACTALPPSGTQRALYVDLRRVVETRERAGWLIDDFELEEALGAGLQSVCQVPPPERQELDLWLDGELARYGGSAEAAWEQAERDLGAIEEALTLSRVRGLLNRAEGSVASCPFWLEPADDFAGVQSDQGRFVILVESRGGGEVSQRDNAFTFGGFGGGRVLPAWGVGETVTLGAGIEMGGGGAISEGADGSQDVGAAFHAAIPVLLRMTDIAKLWDVELAAATIFTTNRIVAAPGPRISVGGGIATSRIGSFMPTAVFQLSYGYHPPLFGAAAAHVFSIGTRVGVNIDP